MIKKLATIGVGAALFAATAVPAFAAGPVVSDNASPNACFGQARASYAQGGPNGLLSPNNNGFWISQRKGDNPAVNAAYIAANCTV